MFKIETFTLIMTYVLVSGSLVPLPVGGKLDQQYPLTAGQAPFWAVQFW